MAAVDALLELCVDVEGHLGVGVADLAHDPLHVEVVGEQRHGDVGAAQRVRRRGGERREAECGAPLGRVLPRVGNHRADALAIEAVATEVGHEPVLGADGAADAAQPVNVLDDGFDEVWAHLDLADAGLGLCVGDPEACAVAVVNAHVADADVAQLAGADARAGEDLADDTAADVAAAELSVEARRVPAHGRLGESEPLGDLVRTQALAKQRADHGSRGPDLRLQRRGGERDLLVGGGVEQRGELVHLQERARRLGHAYAHALAARWVVGDVLILDSVVEDRGEAVDELAQRCGRQRDGAATAVVADVGAGIERSP